jgi:histidinol-phosphate aminotransferase
MASFVGPIHPYLDELEPYVPPDLRAVAAKSGMPGDELIRLSANENQLGPSPAVPQALARYSGYAFYPEYGPLREALGRHVGVGPGQVVVTNGADEAIDLLVRLLVEPGQTVVVCPPTFGMYEFCARVNRCRVLAVPRRANFTLDLPSIRREVNARAGDARLLFLASPGNPHGLATSLDELSTLLDLPVYIAVDEAYIAFGGDSAISLLRSRSNLVVIRTLSKWAGLAGLRLGYTVSDEQLACSIERIRAPYNVNSAAVVAALATLGDLGTVRANVRLLIAERERVRSALAGLGWLEPLPSQTNFLLCRVGCRTGQDVADALANRGIVVGTFSDPPLEPYVRIAVGRPEQNDTVIAALASLAPRREGESA